MDNNQRVIVVLGVDAERKPHASSFTEADAVAAARAAQLMGFYAVRVEDEGLRQLAASLPAGKIFVTGRGLVPFVKRDVYDKLAGLIGTASELKREGDGDTANGEPTAAGREPDGDAAANDARKANAAIVAAAEPEANAGPAPDPWSAITVGSIILAESPNDDEGWYEALVTAVSADGQILSMRWRDYPNVPLANTQRSKVAVIGPGKQ